MWQHAIPIVSLCTHDEAETSSFISIRFKGVSIVECVAARSHCSRDYMVYDAHGVLIPKVYVYFQSQEIDGEY